MATLPLTKKQKDALHAYQECGSERKTAELLGLTRSGVRSLLEGAKKRGHHPSTAPAYHPEGQVSHKTTVQYDADGNVVQEWRRYSKEAELITDLVNRLSEQVKGKARVPKFKERKSDSDKEVNELCLYDLHFGMYAHGLETGDADYDTDIASKRLLHAVDDLLGRSNRPDTIRIVLGGDQLHMDDNTNATPHSKNVLDVDTRYSLVINKLVSACREAVQMACTIGKNIEIYVIAGNHDPVSSLWLQTVLEAYYHNCPNVTVCGQQTPRKWATWGKCLSVYGHGDRIKASNWAGIVAAELSEQWGLTKYRYARLGHIHTKRIIAPIVVDENSGLEVTFLPSLASSDAWHSQSGYVGNNKGMQAFTLHKDAGQIASYTHNLAK